MTCSQRTVIFWGAGATASLGIQTTPEQTKALQKLASGQKEQESLTQRIENALEHKVREPWISALGDLLTILGEEGNDENSENEFLAFPIAPRQMAAMRRNWRRGASDAELRDRIVALRRLYDWPALKAAISVCPGAQDDGSRFQLNDLFNVLDMHSQSSHGFLAKKDNFLTPQRVLGARNALKMILLTMFYIDWHCGREAKSRDLEHHYDFAKALGRRMQRQGMKLAGNNTPFDSRSFYMGDCSFVSFNYDPIALWCQFVANRDLNRSKSLPYIGSPAAKLKIFHDLGHFVAGSRVELKQYDKETPWHPMNETSAQRLNDSEHASGDRIRISKFLFPHGCLWWRECPNCGKLSSYMGDSWEWDSATLIPPPPLKAFVQDVEFMHRFKEEREAWDQGEVDARACVHCQTLTYAHHTQTLMQSNFKSPPPPFLEEIKRDLRVAIQNADHIILMGYTLPPDDVDYRAFIAARRRREGEGDRPVRCSVVVGTEYGSQWHDSSAWRDMLLNMEERRAPRTTLEAARDLFGESNVRFYGGGIPDVFLSGGSGVTDAAVEKLLTWERS